LTQVSNSAATIDYLGYDAMENVTGSDEVISGITYSFGYSYDLASDLTGETYPSGRVITNAYDSAARITAVSGVYTSQTNYVSGATYWPHGAPRAYTYGNNVVPVFTYNQRLQPYQIYATRNNDPNQYLWFEDYFWDQTDQQGPHLSAITETCSNVVS